MSKLPQQHLQDVCDLLKCDFANARHRVHDLQCEYQSLVDKRTDANAEIERLKEIILSRTVALHTACGCAQEERPPSDTLLNQWREALGWEPLFKEAKDASL